MAETKTTTAKTTEKAVAKEEKIDVKSMNIYQKLAKISQAIGVMAKEASGYNYNYVSEDKIQAKLNGAMETYHVYLMFEIVHGTECIETVQTLNKRGEPAGLEYRYSAQALYTWINLDNIEDKKVVPWVIVGQMADPSQAFGAAVTYCNRYFLLKEFQLPTTNDDPDKIRSLQQQTADYEIQKEEKKRQDELKPVITAIGDAGKKLMSQLGYSADDVKAVIAAGNDGDSNRMNIKSAEVGNAIIEKMNTLLKEGVKKGE